MAVNSMSFHNVSSNVQVSTLSPTDTETKNILNEITSRQKSLNRLSSDSKISEEEKAKESQEIQKQIAELNRKLRILRQEKKEEIKEAKKEQEQKAALEEETKKSVWEKESDESDNAEKEKEDLQKINISPQNAQKLLEAGTVLQKDRIQQSVEQKREGSIKVMESEISLDKLYGSDVSEKEEKLSSLRKKKIFESDLPNIEERQKPKNVPLKDKPIKIVIRDDEV